MLIFISYYVRSCLQVLNLNSELETKLVIISVCSDKRNGIDDPWIP